MKDDKMDLHSAFLRINEYFSWMYIVLLAGSKKRVGKMKNFRRITRSENKR